MSSGESPSIKWTDKELQSEEISKRELVYFMQEQAAPRFLTEKKLKGTLKNIIKSSKRDDLIKAYFEMYEKNAFKGSEYDIEVEKVVTDVKKLEIVDKKIEVEEKVEEVPRFTKKVLKKGNKINFPKKGDLVSCYYVGKLEDGTVFDSLQPGSKKRRNQPLKFKVGKGNVIKGWDEGLLGMSVGEKAELKIEASWAYGKAGKPEAKIPPNANLIFEVDLVQVD